MKLLRLVVTLVTLTALLSGCSIFCRLCEKRPSIPATFSKQVVSNTGVPVAGATVDVNGTVVITDKKGFFHLMVSPSPANKYFVNIRKSGYGPLSQIYDKSVLGKRWILTEATVVAKSPARRIKVRDVKSRNGCLGTRVAPPAITLAGCSPGITIEIPPNALVDANGNPPPPGTNVEIALATVDLYSPDAMPGDYTVELPGGQTGYMVSFGAGSVEVTAGGQPYQLNQKKKAQAKLTIPIDPTLLQRLKQQGTVPDTYIPLLVYNEKQDMWMEDGQAKLNTVEDLSKGCKIATCYEATISHLSAFNMDLIKRDQACIQVDSRLIAGNYNTTLTITKYPPYTIDIPRTPPLIIQSPPSTSSDPLFYFFHTFFNLPSAKTYADHGVGGTTKVSIVPRKGTVTLPLVETLSAVPQQVPSTPNRPNYTAFNTVDITEADKTNKGYTACRERLTLSAKPTLTASATDNDVTLTWDFAPFNTTHTPAVGPTVQIVPASAADSHTIEFSTGMTGPSWSQPPDLDVSYVRSTSTDAFAAAATATTPAGTYFYRAKTHVGHPSFGASGYDPQPSDTVAIRFLNKPDTLAHNGATCVQKNSSATVSWSYTWLSASDTNDQFELTQIAPGAASTTSLINRGTTSQSVTFSQTGTYEFRVRAKDYAETVTVPTAGGVPHWSPVSTVLTVPVKESGVLAALAARPAPTSTWVQSSGASATGDVEITWSDEWASYCPDAANLDNYRVDKRTLTYSVATKTWTAGAWAKVTDVPGSTRSHTMSEGEGVYEYRVCPWRGTSACSGTPHLASDPVTVGPDPSTTKPTVTSQTGYVAATATNVTVGLTWTYGSWSKYYDNVRDGYEVEFLDTIPDPDVWAAFSTFPITGGPKGTSSTDRDSPKSTSTFVRASGNPPAQYRFRMRAYIGVAATWTDWSNTHTVAIGPAFVTVTNNKPGAEANNCSVPRDEQMVRLKIDGGERVDTNTTVVDQTYSRFDQLNPITPQNVPLTASRTFDVTSLSVNNAPVSYTVSGEWGSWNYDGASHILRNYTTDNVAGQCGPIPGNTFGHQTNNAVTNQGPGTQTLTYP